MKSKVAGQMTSSDVKINKNVITDKEEARGFQVTPTHSSFYYCEVMN